MTKRDRRRYARKLLEEKLRLLREIGVKEEELAELAREASGDLSSFTFHIADQSGETYRRELKASLTSEQTHILRAIDEALKRIHDGTFGICSRCGDKIKKERLDYVPYAKCCIKCQRLLEGA
jgi:DnaK suppressor protein